MKTLTESCPWDVVRKDVDVGQAGIWEATVAPSGSSYDAGVIEVSGDSQNRSWSYNTGQVRIRRTIGL